MNEHDAHTMLHDLIEAERAYKATLHRVQADGATLFKAIRTEHNLTQREFAAALGVDFTFISKVENGHTRPGKPVLHRLITWLEEEADHER